MGIIKDIKKIITEYRENESFDKIDLCNWLQDYIDKYAKQRVKYATDYQKDNVESTREYSAKWKKDNPEEYKTQQREYKRKVNGYYEKHSKEILSKADDSLKDNRDAEIIEVGIKDEKESNDE